MTTNLDTLDVPQPLIDRTLTVIKTLATSAGVRAGELQTFTNYFYTLRDGESSLPSNPYYHFEDAGLFYTQHLRGFFRHWRLQKVAAEAKLKVGLQTTKSATQVDAAGAAVLHRDARLLESLGAAVPSTTNQQFDDAYLAAFAIGVLTPQIQSQPQSRFATILGAVATAPRIASTDRLVAHSPTFARATGAPSANVQNIVKDVGALVNDGGGQSLNPFKVTIVRTSLWNQGP